jgi:hypothetical protein
MEEVTMNEEATEEKEIDVSGVIERVEKEMEKATDTKVFLQLLGHYEKLQDMSIRIVSINNESYKIDVNKEIEMAKIESQENLKKMEIASNEKEEQAKRELQEALSLKEQKTSTRNELIRGGCTIGAAVLTGVLYLVNNKNNRRFIHALDIMHLNYDKTAIISSVSKDDLRTAMNTLDIKPRF